jgi:hypothetical protein
MKASKRVTIYLLGAILVLLFTAGESFGSLLPEDLVMEEVFKAGIGHSVGKVQLVQGKVVILHKGEVRGYWAQEDLPLFKGDTIVTKEKGRIRFNLNDKSVITLSSNTKLVITKSVYDPENKIRSTFFNMTLGKVKFWVQKLSAFKHSRFKVKSTTAVVGVRGSEWIEDVTENNTRVITGTDTTLEIVPLGALEMPPTVLEDFQDINIERDMLPSEKELITPEEYDQLQEPFEMPVEADATASVQPQMGTQKDSGKATSAAVKEEGGDEESTDEGDEKAAEEEAGDEESTDEGDEEAAEEEAVGEESTDEGDEMAAGEEAVGEESADEGDEMAAGEETVGEESADAGVEEPAGAEAVGEESADAGVEEPAGAEACSVEIAGEGIEAGEIAEVAIIEEIELILVSEQELVDPELIEVPEAYEAPEAFEEPTVTNIAEIIEVDEQIESFTEQQEAVSEEAQEEVIEEQITIPPDQPLPGMPPLPP